MIAVGIIEDKNILAEITLTNTLYYSIVSQ